MEEPPTKLTKFEVKMESQYLEGEVEEGQEEWLSEGILTDDDYNPAQSPEPDHTDSNIASQDETINSGSADDSQSQLETSTQLMDSNVSNIEETLNNLENSQNNNQTSDFPEELNAFLIRKTDGKIVDSEPQKKESDIDESAKQSEDDGNDTDDLLRVLGGGDQAPREIKKEKSEVTQDDSSEDDNYIFEGKRVKNFHVARKVLNRVPATKAVPEDDDPTDCSTDEGGSVKKVFPVKKVKSPSTVTPQISTTVKPGNFTITPLKAKEEPPKKRVVKKVIDVPHKLSNKQGTAAVTPTPASKPEEVQRPPAEARRQYVNRRVQRGGASLLKLRSDAQTTQKQHTTKQENIQLDEDFTTQKPKETKSSQRLMCPEKMEEEVPTDAESDSDEESLYSELPSSDSDTEDWFTLDIRSERAGEYLPLLGKEAYQLLSEEKRRVKSRLDTLKKSLSSLSNSGREIADQLREATSTVAELDAMMKVV